MSAIKRHYEEKYGPNIDDWPGDWVERRFYLMHVEYPTERPNFVVVHLPDCALAFSYRTLIGVKTHLYGFRWVLAKNEWGPTTGKHLNLLDHFNHERVPQAEVERIAYEILTGKAQALLTDLHTAHNAAIEAFK